MCTQVAEAFQKKTGLDVFSDVKAKFKLEENVRKVRLFHVGAACGAMTIKA